MCLHESRPVPTRCDRPLFGHWVTLTRLAKSCARDIGPIYSRVSCDLHPSLASLQVVQEACFLMTRPYHMGALLPAIPFLH